jgi:TonB-dependent SusC/RagA subfamily outer membrane receptor
MEKVWNRVEEKLDKKELKKATNLWKKIAVAASLLLVTTLGYQFLKEDQPTINTNDVIVQKDSVQKTTPNNNAVVSAETLNPAIKEEAEAILNEQIVVSSQVAVQEVSESIKGINDSLKYVFTSPRVVLKSASPEILSVASETNKAEDMEVFINKENRVSNAKKEMPLLVFDDKVTNKQSVKEVAMDEIDSIIVLPDPLYIINGIEYTEQELFGPNPTSPYTPLNEQEIDSISILQDEKATSIYGAKGKKGVVIISTKNGKPKAKKHK